MRIRKLELQGFKSFADRAAFHFGAGISGVVGPNGCGKSNVVDAVKWCIGEQSAKSLRGESMADVIFAGSSVRGAVGFAEVSLTFEAGGEPFPGIWQRFAELEVTRRLFRDGHSEYRVNQDRVRLRDIQDLFMDTGVGNQLYSVIEQGRIGQIVHAKPEQRRTLIEEAAGISRYKARREETMERLGSTRGALERVSDLAEEMARQLKAAERQVQKVSRWRALQARVRQEEIAVGLARCAALIGDRRVLSEQARAATAEVQEGGRAVDRHEQELAARRTSLEGLEEETGRARDRLAELETQRRVEESAAQYQGREVSGAQARLARLAQDQTDARTERDSAAAEAERATAGKQEAERGLGRARAGLDTASAAAQAANEAARVARAAHDAARRESMQGFEGAVRARSQVAAVTSRRSDLAVREARNRSAAQTAGATNAQVEEEIARISALLAEADASVAATRQAVETARARTAASEAARDAAGRDLKRLDAALTDATRERERIKARLDALEDLLRRNVDVPDGLKPALAVPGAVGLLSAFLDVPEAEEGILARALDGALETVLVADAATAVKVAASVRGAKARIWILGSVPAGEPGERWSRRIGGTDAGREALDALLGDCEMVATVADALAAWRPGRRFATRDGALLREDGLLLLGQDTAGGTAGLRRRREVAALKEQVQVADGAVGARRDEVEGARAALRVAEGAVATHAAGTEGARSELRAGEAAAAEIRHRLREQESERTRALRAAEALAAEAAAITRDRTTLDADETRATEAVKAAEARHQIAEEQVRGRQREIEVLEPELAALQERVSRLREESSGFQKDLAAHQGTERGARERAERAGARSLLIEKERGDLEARLVTLALESQATERRLQELGEGQGRVREELEAGKERVRVERERARASEAATRAARDRRDAAKDRLAALETRLAEIRANLERVRGDTEEKHGISLPALLDRLERDGQLLLEGHSPAPGALGGEEVAVLRVTSADFEGDLAARAAALTVLRESFARLGDVNFAAEDEWREVSGRHTDLERQRTDLVEAMDIIERAIAKINRTCRERFRETFDLVTAHFTEIYPRLVGGGQGRLQLTDEEDLLTCGVEIIIQPPGKRVQNLSLLSGGEKAMAAIGLIFSLFRVKPSPFCLLDEVDAPLDEGNGARFNEMLREMSAHSQFIVITHNKKTMECADVLYGVTMPEPGASRLVTVRID